MRAVRPGITESWAKLRERGLPLLATIGSTAPFIGLFGTVIGIMNAFIEIGQSQSTNLAVVAPGIAEALFTTAFGLVVALITIFPHAAFRAQADRCLARLEVLASTVIEATGPTEPQPAEARPRRETVASR